MLLSVCLFIYNFSLSPPAVLSRVVLHLVASNLHIPEFLLGSVAVLLQPKFYLHFGVGCSASSSFVDCEDWKV
jgi:hypothetical protein